MKRRTFRIRMWLIFAVATASLAVTSSASALRNAADQSGAFVAPAPVTSTPSSFDWLNAALVAAVIVVVSCIGLAYFARNRSHGSVATSH